MPDRIVVLVHGWSVSNTDTYGGLADRLESEAKKAKDLRLDVRQIWLGKYVSFKDPVRVEDIARGFQAAIEKELEDLIEQGRRFVCITHSTGGPVVREWWHRFHRRVADAPACPMSHLIMLAPANYGSALAQLGAGRLSRMKAWFDGVQPGAGVLEWLELGSEGAWDLGLESMRTGDPTTMAAPVFPFVLTGQSIDRSLFDNLNTYTGEAGSDGVVRTAAANLNATYVRIEQADVDDEDGDLEVKEKLTAPRTAFALIRGRSHSGDDMGILRSVKDDAKPHPTVTAILDCLRVENHVDYVALCDKFDAANVVVREKERVEVVRRILLKDTVFFHDAHSMVMFRVRDDEGRAVADFDLLLTAGTKQDPNKLPEGFFVDRQRNHLDPEALTYYFNHDVMKGLPATNDSKGVEVREAQPGIKDRKLGLVLSARPDSGFVHYKPARLVASTDVLDQFLQPDQTTLVDICLTRVIHEGVFEMTQEREPEEFRNVKPGGPIS